MPSVEDVSLPYEILIRFGDDGRPRGAHAQFIRRVSVDGELLKEEIGNAVPLDLDGLPTSSLMSDATRDALAEVERLNAEVETLTNRANAAESSAASVGQANEQLGQENEQLKRDLFSASERISDLEAARRALAADVATLKAAVNAAEKTASDRYQRIEELEAAANAALADAQKSEPA